MSKAAARDIEAIRGWSDTDIYSSALAPLLAPLKAIRHERIGPATETAPLNAEQFEAVQAGLSAPMTVVTGPPGTGKSQCVTALVASTVASGGCVLVAARNHQALDAIEERIGKDRIIRMRDRTGEVDRSLLSVTKELVSAERALKVLSETADVKAALFALSNRRNETFSLIREKRELECKIAEVIERIEAIEALAPDLSTQGTSVQLGWLSRLVLWLGRFFSKRRSEEAETGSDLASLKFEVDDLRKRSGRVPAPEDPVLLGQMIVDKAKPLLDRIFDDRLAVASERVAMIVDALDDAELAGDPTIPENVLETVLDARPVWLTSLGLAERERVCLEKVSADANDPRVARALGLADLPTLLAMSAPGATNSELIRLENGDWIEAVGSAPGVQDAPDLGAFFDAADHIFLHGPCQPELLDAIRALLQRSSSKKIDVADPSAVAHGAFLVAMRVRQGLPPWYDCLPNVETIVQDREEAESLSLVGEDEAAEAGKTWRSSKPITLRWPAGSISMKVWLKKDDDPEPRMSPATVLAAPDRDEKVQLYLEQQPAQGRAKLRITSETWPFLQERPAIVDWDAGEQDPDGRDWETIISDFKVRPPVIPERVILPAHNDLWYPEQGDGLAGALRGFDGKNYTPVYKALSARRRVYLDQPNHPDHDRVFYAVDSDGGRPSGVKDEDWDLLLEVISQAEADFTTGNAKNNHALGVLSWSFRLCPATVWPIVVRVLRKNGGPPSFPGWRIMYPHALGRTAADSDAFTAAIDYLNSLGFDWTKDQQACAAFLLSRNDEIFEILDPATIDRWASVAQASLKQGLRKGFGNNQYYLPILIAGLLRWRFREPNAFAPIHDTKGEVFADLLERASNRYDIDQRQRAAYQTVLDAISDTGARPDLLQTLFDLL